MPSLGKKIFSQFVSNPCSKKLRLESCSDDNDPSIQPLLDAAATNHTDRQFLTDAGRAFEEQCFSTLRQKYGTAVIDVFGDMKSAIINAEPNQIFIEAEYGFTPDQIPSVIPWAHTYESTHNKKIHLQKTRPDILHILPPSPTPQAITPEGTLLNRSADDTRLGIRIIDCKLGSEAKSRYFAEIVYYCLMLAKWLRENQLDDQFYVAADAGIWCPNQTWESLYVLPSIVFLKRINYFIEHEMKDCLMESNWRNLPWYVGEHCRGCQFLGFQWVTNKENESDNGYWAVENTQCSPVLCAAESCRESHISQISGISPGLNQWLAQQGASIWHVVDNQPEWQNLIDRHPGLKAHKNWIDERAKLLGTGNVVLRTQKNPNLVLPDKVDVKITWMVEYDSGTSRAAAFAWHIHLGNKKLRNIPALKDIGGGIQIEWVNEPDDEHQIRGFVGAMRSIHEDLLRIAGLNFMEHSIDARSLTMQVYFWDAASHEFMQSLVGRYLAELSRLGAMDAVSWLFSPKEGAAWGQGEAKNLVCLVSSQARWLLNADIPFRYDLIPLARAYNTGQKPAEFFSVPTGFSEPLSDKIPASMLYEFWGNGGNKTNLEKAIRTRLAAVFMIAERLVRDIKSTGFKAPSGPPLLGVLRNDAAEKCLQTISSDGRIWLEYARLDKAVRDAEMTALLALPPEEREALHRSVRVKRCLDDVERSEYLLKHDLKDAGNRFVFEIHPESRDARIKTGDFTWSLIPEDRLNYRQYTLENLCEVADVPEKLRAALRGIHGYHAKRKLMDVCQVSVEWFDRQNGYLVVDASEFVKFDGYAFMVAAVSTSWFVFGSGIMDPLSIDFFLPKLQNALTALGNPAIAETSPLVCGGSGKNSGSLSVNKKDNPADDFIWRAESMYEASFWGGRLRLMDNDPLLASVGYENLSGQQKEAFTRAVSKRLSLLWGPPGTGKSYTAKAFLLYLLAKAEEAKKPIRVLVTGPTWTAIDNIVMDIPSGLSLLELSSVKLTRLRSGESERDTLNGALKPYACTSDTKSAGFRLFCKELLEMEVGGGHVVAATPIQVSKIIRQLTEKDSPQKAELFDYILIDEASQMDVANAIIVLTSLASNGAVCVVGDHLQMPPIHSVDPPKGMEFMAGSIYSFYQNYRSGDSISPVMLNINRRSNETIVNCIRGAGYGEMLTSAFPDQKMKWIPSSASAPNEWPEHLCWSPAWTLLLNPDYPVSLLVHSDETSGQKNEAEAHAAACLLMTLWGRLLPLGADESPMDIRRFLTQGIGIVTPHRAQQSAVIDLLEKALPLADHEFNLLYESVDTVERFQGQQRAVMIASLGVGDCDQIRMEERFLFSLNRFNVIASRAQTKLIILISESMVQYLPSEPGMMHEAGFLKSFVPSQKRGADEISVPFFEYARIECLE